MKHDPHQAIDYIIKHGQKFADAKAQRIYLEEFRKSKKALLMQKSMETTVNAQERDAYAHPEYIELLDGIRQAVEIEEGLRWNLVAAQARVDVWRSEQANLRTEGKVTV